MQFDGAFGASEFRPVIQAGAQINDRRIQTEQLVFKADLAQPAVGLFLTAAQEFQKNRLIQLPGAMLIGVGQGRALGRIRQSQMPQLAFAGRQAAANLAKRLRATQVAEQHGHELAPAGEAPGMALSPVLDNGSLELGAGKQLQHLTENTGYSYHGGVGPP